MLQIMGSDRWKNIGSSPQMEDTVQEKSQRTSCGYILCTVLLSVAVLLAVTVTGAVLFMNHYHAPSTEPPPVITTNMEDPNALVTIERADSSHISIFIDPNCPDPFPRLDGLQSSLLSALANHDSELKVAVGKERALLASLADQVAQMVSQVSRQRADWESLRKGQNGLVSELVALQSEQGRLIQLLSEGQSHVAQLVSSVSEVLDTVQREHGRPRGKGDLVRAPARNARPRGCTNGSKPRDCYDIFMSGHQEDGVYSVFPIHYPSGFQVFCDMTTDGGGWTVFQRREDGSVSFFRGWEQYRDGFGKLTEEHWLGLQRIHFLTMQTHYQLRIDLMDFDNATAYAQYNTFGVGLFSVNAEEDGYPLTVSDYSGTAGDSLGKHSGMKFTTKDMDNDHSENNCASFYHGAWWYRNCHTSNLNGQYLRGHHPSYADGIEWSSWTGWQYSLKFTEMKIRPQRDDK
ncbi:fibrinogen C domain-containing protein 1 isoform X1 [Mixophyes fleayi]|uniref:fibrinogen C domain-containing protein 1 isoform X1 n=2 Tax=Mixophyes fleayi TaxID=3061075 RepID=UPI003F4DB84A